MFWTRNDSDLEIVTGFISSQKPSTRYQYSRILTRWLEFLNGCKLSKAKPYHAESWVKQLANSPGLPGPDGMPRRVCDATVSKYIHAMKSCHDAIIRNQDAPMKNPFDKVAHDYSNSQPASESQLKQYPMTKWRGSYLHHQIVPKV